MSANTSVLNIQEDSKEESYQLRRIFFRVVPYTPLIIIATLIGISCSYIYMRYATRTYAAKARLIVNDDTQQKNSNLLDIIKLDTRNLSAETEREMQIIRSRDLLRNLVIKLQMNIQYGLKGYVTTGEYFKNAPLKLELEHPDSIISTISGEVGVVNNTIRFNGKIYPVDSLVKSDFGNIRWHINSAFQSDSKKNVWFVTIHPLSQTVEQAQRALTIEPISKQSSILDLTYIDVIPERGVNVLNNLISLYGTTTVDYKSRISANTLSFLDERLRLVSDELSGVEKNLQSFKTNEGIVDLGTEGSLFLEQLKDTDSKIGELEVQIDVLSKIEQYVSRRNNTNSPIPATLGTTDPVLIGLLNQLYESEFELEKTKQISGSKNPQIEVYEEAIARLKPSILTSINNLKMGMQSSRQRLQKDNNKLTGTLNKIPQKERLLLDISRQQGIKNAIYTFLLQKREESAIAAAAILPNYRVIERPESTGIAVSPVGKRIYLFGTFIAIFLIGIFIYFKEFANSRIMFRSQIESALTVPVIAELSFQPNETGSPVVVGSGSRSLIGEQFRELRTNLKYITATTTEKCKVILTTSSIPGEGKSFVAINTAVSLALTGARVIIMEFDLRKPKISKELGIEREPGLSNYLISMATEKDIIKAHPTIANFNIIPCGPIPPNPAELISGPRLTELINYLKQHFDYIIIDSPPIGAVTDAKILASLAHATLYIVRHNYTSNTLISLMKDVQQKNFLPNLNIVFNGITSKKVLGYSYGKEYGYGYGYGYGYEEDGKKKK
ncbi:MAG: polysaccharide biosynthesis tyrosine autokinase [Ferruginibacter sp.]|nr:polysaccharide biosynthesis tyrosine autokinase [Ferruginibacter sp.]